MLRCLTEKQPEISSPGCRSEVLYFLKMEVSDYRNDVMLAAACRGDVEKFCKDIAPGARPGAVHECLRKNGAQLTDACRREQLLLEAQQAAHVELRPGLAAACAGERARFCKSVEAGGGRVFRCLADSLADPDFGQPCRREVISKIQRRQANWRLDPALRRACREDAREMCQAEDDAAAETGAVYKCLMRGAESLGAGCRKELGRALHMAFFVFVPGGILTSACDADVADVCLKERPNLMRETGTVAACLADAVRF